MAEREEARLLAIAKKAVFAGVAVVLGLNVWEAIALLLLALLFWGLESW